MINWKRRAFLSAALILALIGTACGGGSNGPKPSASSQGFIPAPQSTTTAASTSTTVATPAPTTPTPTPLGTPDVQASAQANGCSVTPFAANGPPQMHATVYPQWYSQGDLWFAPASIYAEFGIEQFAATSVWFQGSTSTIVVANDDPTITGHLKDDATTTVTTTPGSAQLTGAVRPEEPVYGVVVTLPKPGCWELNIASGSDTLNVTLWAVPLAQRPDVASLIAYRSQFTPYPPPSTCSATTWSGPSEHGTPFVADYWIDGQDITVDSAVPVFFATQSNYLDVYHAFPDPPSLSGQLDGNTAAVVRSSWIQRSTEFSSNGWRGEMTFSNPGCWQLQVTDGSAKVDLTLYVYPSDCYHAQNQPKPATCKPPA